MEAPVCKGHVWKIFNVPPTSHDPVKRVFAGTGQDQFGVVEYWECPICGHTGEYLSATAKDCSE